MFYLELSSSRECIVLLENASASVLGLKIEMPASWGPARVSQCLPDRGIPTRELIHSLSIMETLRLLRLTTMIIIPPSIHSTQDHLPSTPFQTQTRSDCQNPPSHATRHRLVAQHGPSPESSPVKQGTPDDHSDMEYLYSLLSCDCHSVPLAPHTANIPICLGRRRSAAVAQMVPRLGRTTLLAASAEMNWVCISQGRNSVYTLACHIGVGDRQLGKMETGAKLCMLMDEGAFNEKEGKSKVRHPNRQFNENHDSGDAGVVQRLCSDDLTQSSAGPRVHCTYQHTILSATCPIRAS
ncbi:hypothetical protein BDW72DRAFT_132349 [Aspergillus terricola var. indicus]